MKILILKPSSLGDVVQALPVLRLIKAHLPKAEVHWWLDGGLKSLLEGDPDLAAVIPFERRRWSSPGNWGEVWRVIRRLRREKYDWVIDLQCLARTGIVAWLANGRLAVGLDEPREGARGFYDIVVRRDTFHTHAVDWYLSVLPHLGVPVHKDFTWLPVRPEAAESVKARWNPGGRWVAIQPGARWSNKRWPVEYFAELVRRMADEDPEARFAILGGGDDVELGAKIARVDPERCLNLAGQLSLTEMVEWIRACELMVSNDTGPMHVAAALGKPVVALFGPTEPRRTGPYGQVGQALQLQLSCVPCLKPVCRHAKPLECLRALTPAMVHAAARQRLAAAS